MKRNHNLILALMTLVLVSLACQSLSGTQPANDQPANDQTDQPIAADAPAQQDIEPAVVTSQGTGIACIGSKTGLSCLTEDGWQAYTEENSELPNNYLYAGAVCPNGEIAIAHISGLSLFNGSTFSQIPEISSATSPEGIACGEDGAIWVAHFRGVSRYSNGQWTTFGSENLASGESANELVYDVEVAPDGKVWVVTSRSVAMFENETWKVFQEGQGFDGSRFFNALALDAKGRPWAASGSGLDVFENGTWNSFDSTDYNSPEAIAIDAKGQAWLGTISAGVMLFNGNTWTKYTPSSGEISSDHVKSIAADSGGRVWLGTSYGLTVFDGTAWQTLFMGNSGLVDNNIEFVVVTNDGPVLPALEEKARGSLTGQLEKADGSPLVDVVVEICVETIGSTFYGDTPCSDQPFFLTTRTNADGVFLIEDVPAGYYVVVSETGTGWAQLTDKYGITSERTLIQAGEQYDIGTLTLEE